MTRIIFLVLVFAGFYPPSAFAQELKIHDVHVGFRAADTDYFRPGTWAPVAVDVETSGDSFEGQLVVEAVDGDGVRTRSYPRQVAIPRDGRKVLLSYTKVGGGGEVEVHLGGTLGSEAVRRSFRYPNDSPGRERVPRNLSGAGGLPYPYTLMLALGQPKGLDLPGPADKGKEARAALWRVAFENEIARLPEHWYGYEGVDIIVLATGGDWNASLAKALADDPARHQALERWVRMGGHLVVSVSANHRFVGRPDLFPLEPMLPAQVDPRGRIGKDAAEGVRKFVQEKTRVFPSALEVELARLLRPFRAPAQQKTYGQEQTIPAIVEGPHGQGRVTLIAFDTDQGAFAQWENRRDFWPALLDLRSGSAQSLTAPGPKSAGDPNFDLTSQLCTQVEDFRELAPVSFGWVALLIFGYILVVGPLEYIILKKVLKHLEFTWVTFPLVVLAVGLGAYFLARNLKGEELRINKIDVIDIDLRRGQAYGTTWFTIFSPRFEHFQLGVEPAGFGGSPEGLVVSWMGRPGTGARGTEREPSPGLFRRYYDYGRMEQATAGADPEPVLKGVPVQVWSMKTLTARWLAPLPKERLLESMLQNPGRLQGAFTWRLPQRLEECYLVANQTDWELGALEPRQTVALQDSQSLENSLLFSGKVWLQTASMSRLLRRDADGSQPVLHDLIRRMLFHQRIAGPAAAAQWPLDYLDQSWRLNYSEAMLVGRLPDAEGPIADVNQQQRLGSRLSPLEPSLRGRMRQTTMVRIFIPIDRDTKE